MSGKRSRGFGKHLVSALCLPRSPRQEKEKDTINIFGKMVSTQENTQTRARMRARTRGLYGAYHAYRLPRPERHVYDTPKTQLDKMTRSMVEWKYSRDRTPAQTERDTKMSKVTKSGKVNRLIEQAEALGLEVTIEDASNTRRDTYSININVKNRTELPYFDLARGQIFIYASRYIVGGSAKAFRIHGTYLSALAIHTNIKPSELASYIRVLHQFATDRQVAA